MNYRLVLVQDGKFPVAGGLINNSSLRWMPYFRLIGIHVELKFQGRGLFELNLRSTDKCPNA